MEQKEIIALSLFGVIVALLFPIFLYSKIKLKKLKIFASVYFLVCPFIIVFSSFYSGDSLEMGVWISALIMPVACYFGYCEKKGNKIAHIEFKKYIYFIVFTYAIAPIVAATLFLIFALILNNEGGFMMAGISLTLLGLTWKASLVSWIAFMFFSQMEIYRSTEPITPETPSTSE
jgi:hypothetical protein